MTYFDSDLSPEEEDEALARYDAGDFGFWSTDEHILSTGQCDICRSARHTSEEHWDLLIERHQDPN